MRYTTHVLSDVFDQLQDEFGLEDDLIWDAMDSAIAQAKARYGKRYTGTQVYQLAEIILLPDDE